MNDPSAVKDRPILITGATGFIGSYLLRYLLHRGYRNLRAIRRATSTMELLGPAADQVEWVEGNITDPVFVEEAVSEMDWVFHCAAVVSFDPRQAGRMMQANALGTTHLVNAALQEGIGKLLHMSSVATLGRIRNNMYLSEKNTWQRSRFNTNYAISKFQAEQEVWRGMAEGLSAVIVNPSVVLGSGKWEEGTARLFTKASRGLHFFPTGATGFVDVRDVARFSVLLMESGSEGQRFLLNAENRTYRWLLETICRYLDTKPPAYRATPLMLSAAWRLSWLYTRLSGSAPMLTPEIARNASNSFSFDNSKSLQAFPFSYLPIEETIAATCRQFLEAREEKGGARVLPFVEVPRQEVKE